MSPPAPDCEARRLHALRRYDILDTPPEAAFDRITGLIARLLGVPIALVSLVGDEWQFFKSCYGLDVTETPRDVSFCAHAIESDGVMVVEDAREDPRFAANPLVLGEPFIRFYAGAPLRTADGFNLGTLCAIDHAPRGLGPAEAATLRDLAAMVVDEMELRREVDQRRKAEARAQAHARLEAVTVRDVVFQINAAGVRLPQRGLGRLTGFEVGESAGRPFTCFMREEDRAAAQAGFEATLRAPGEMPDRYETRCLTATSITLALLLDGRPAYWTVIVTVVLWRRRRPSRSASSPPSSSKAPTASSAPWARCSTSPESRGGRSPSARSPSTSGPRPRRPSAPFARGPPGKGSR